MSGSSIIYEQKIYNDYVNDSSLYFHPLLSFMTPLKKGKFKKL